MGTHPLNDDDFRAGYLRPDIPVGDMSEDELAALLARLERVPATPEQQRELEASLPSGDPDAPTSVVRSLRLPAELSRRLDAAAAAESVPASVFIRRAIESALAGRVRSNLVSLDDVYRALGSLPKAAA
jgi:hypothetical protein